jgi:hypothetical protein
MKSNTYHNSTNQNDDFVKLAIKSCKSQDDKAIAILNLKGQSTPSEVWKVYNNVYQNIPLTSIRRALSNLCYDGKVCKLYKTKIGLYGKPEHYYTLTKVFRAKK